MKQTHTFIKQAFYELCPTFQIIFNSLYYEDIEVIGTKKPTWEEVLKKADEIELVTKKDYYLNLINKEEAEARERVTGSKPLPLVAHWNNQKIIADKIIKGVHELPEYEAFEAEIEARGLGETMEEFCNKVITNSNIYTKKMCTITGLVKKATIGVQNALDKQSQQDAYNTFIQEINNI